MVSPDGVAPSRIVGVSASVNLPLHHKVQSSLLAPAHPGDPGKRAVKRLWCGISETMWTSILSGIHGTRSGEQNLRNCKLSTNTILIHLCINSHNSVKESSG